MNTLLRAPVCDQRAEEARVRRTPPIAVPAA